MDITPGGYVQVHIDGVDVEPVILLGEIPEGLTKEETRCFTMGFIQGIQETLLTFSEVDEIRPTSWEEDFRAFDVSRETSTGDPTDLSSGGYISDSENEVDGVEEH